MTEASPSWSPAWLAARSLLWTILFPGLFAGYVPWRFFGLDQTRVEGLNATSLLGLICIGLGVVLLAACIVEFARSGRGTLSPVDPPRHLVIRGLYKYVRNPMYLSVTTTEAYRLGRTAALKALELDDMLAEPHTSLAGIAADYDWDWDTADRHFKRAVDLNPNCEAAVRFYSSYLALMGRHEDALALGERAKRLDPVSPNSWHSLGIVHYFARRYNEAIVQFREALDLDPNFGPAHIMLGRVYVAKGLPDRAVEELERARRLLGPRPDVITPYAYVLARAERRREALATLDELRRISKPRDPSPFRIGFVHVGLGETDRAFEWFEKALEARDWQMGMLDVEPAFDDLRSDPRFAALIRRVGLPR